MKIISLLAFPLLLASCYSYGVALSGMDIDNYGKSHEKVTNKQPATDDDKFRSSFLMGYIGGVIDATSEVGMYCLPKSISLGAITDLTIKYIKLHPDENDSIGRDVVISAMQNSFKCSNPPDWMKGK